MKKIKALVCAEHGEPDVLEIRRVNIPAPGSDDVLIRVHACGVNFPDVLMLRGQYQVKPELPFSPGFEVAGEVLEVGSNVAGFAAGDRVIAMLTSGGMQEQVVAPAKRCMKIPKSMTFDVAAGFSLTYGTSYHALIDRARLRPGETLLVLGAAGGVGSAAIDIGQQLGARVIAAGSDKKKLSELQKIYGVDEIVTYPKDCLDLRDQVKAMTNGVGADVIFDPVGGAAFQQAMRCVNWNGRILVVGFASDSQNLPKAATNLLLLKGSALLGVFWGRFVEEEPENSSVNFKQLISWYEEGKIKPTIWRRFNIDEGAQALTALIERQVVGKCVVVF